MNNILKMMQSNNAAQSSYQGGSNSSNGSSSTLQQVYQDFEMAKNFYVTRKKEIEEVIQMF
jgi:hypothetical protein